MRDTIAPLSLRDFLSLRYSAGGHLLTRLVSQRIGAVIAWLSFKLGLTPNLLTIMGTAVFVLASAMFAKLPRGLEYTLLCLAMLQLGYGIDCADGQLARATNRTSTFGAWLDIACDFFRNVLLGSAIIMWLLLARTKWLPTMFVGGIFISGLAIQLHTVTIMRQTHRGEHLQTDGFVSRLRAIATANLDTATVLLLLALLREWPPALAVYAAGIGLLNLFSAVFLAYRRLRTG